MNKVIKIVFYSTIVGLIILAFLPSCLMQKPSVTQAPVDTITETKKSLNADVDTEFYTKIEAPAAFQKGDFNTFITTYLKKNTKYPAVALKKRQQGTVITQFGIDCYGSLKVFSVLKSSGVKVLDDEVVRVLKSSPKWTPAKLGNKSVGQLLMIQIKFNAKTRGIEFK